LLKLFKGLILVIVLITVVFGFYKYQGTPTQVIPYPYVLNLTSVEGQKSAEKSHVLVIGDRMGKALDRFFPTMVTNLSKDLTEPLNIYNWSNEVDGLHRTIAKLKTLKKLPPVIIYHGASKEFYEKKFLIKKRRIILKNFELFDNNKISSIIMTVPELSKFIYKDPQHQYLPKIPREDLTRYKPSYKQYKMELTYKLFEYEIIDLINYVRSHDSELIFITTPINLEIEPKKVCSNATSEQVSDLQDSLFKSYENNQLKTIYTQVKSLALKTLGNARSQYLYGMVSLKLQKYKEAKNALIRAEAFDCSKWRGSTIFNNIMKKKAKRNNVYLIDFNDMVNTNLGRGVIFHDDIYPQHIYYQDVMSLLEVKIRKAYQL
jgi:hypothetical protein